MSKDYKFNQDEQVKCPICGESANYREFPDVVKLISELKKYKQMWEEMEREVQICALHKIFTKNVAVGYLLNILKQKYLKED